ncbi:MAG TPA: hypothetical protein VK618_04765, partial [Flavitalea sp.]|nr:hypothetical protein [Flavitalea sp.]
MPVLIFIDQSEGVIKKSTPEAISFGASIAELLGTTAEGILLGSFNDDPVTLGKYGLKKIYHLADPVLDHPDGQVYTKIISEVAKISGADVIIFSNNLHGKAIAPQLSVALQAGLVTGAIGLPDISSGFTVRKSVFSGKAFATISINTPVKIITLNPNAFPVKEPGGVAELVKLDIVPGSA